MEYAHPEYLVSTDWLAGHLGDPDLRIFDCTVWLKLGEGGQYLIESGAESYAKGHIPGAGFLDLADDLSDPNQKLRFMLPDAESFAAAMGRAGIGEGTRVVLYSHNMSAWATRMWWMLRVYGFDNAAVLDGGWRKWQAENRDISTDQAAYSAAQFKPVYHPEMVADKAAVLTATKGKSCAIINSLPAPMYEGEVAPYGRKGHIASSINIPNADLDDPDSGIMLPAGKLRELFAGTGVLDRDRIITYCGGGIAATYDAFALALIGMENVAVYDASLSEWATDPDTPMEVG